MASRTVLATIVRAFTRDPSANVLAHVSLEALTDAQALGYVEPTTDGTGVARVTDAGAAFLASVELAADTSRKRRNANARARSDAARSVGMVRTPHGWE